MSTEHSTDTQAYLDALVERAAGPPTATATFLVHDDASQPPHPLQVIGLPPVECSPSAIAALRALDLAEQEEDFPRWTEFKWEFAAFVHLQDVFDIPVLADRDPLQTARLWYFYYEAKYLLTESLLAGLNGLYAASRSLLRPFVEFNLLQGYFYRRVRHADGYGALDKYFATGARPGWHKILKSSLPPCSLARPVKKRLDATLKFLSDSSSHAHRPQFSHKHHTGSIPRPSLQGLRFWESIRDALSVVLWLYVLNFPIVLSPRDFVTTFGFAGPVGLVADNYLGMFIRKALGDKDHAQFSAARGADGSIEELLEWVDAQPSLTDAQIWETWDESDGPRPESITKAYAYRMSRLRALREMLAFTLHDRSNDDRDDAEVLSAAARINTLSFWKNPRVGQRKK